MNLYEIRDILATRTNPVSTTIEIARAAQLSKPSAIVSIKRMIDKGMLLKLGKGIYTLDNDPILYASYIIPNSYISFNAALYLHKIIDQIPTTISVAVPKRVKKKIPHITFITLPKHLIFGFTKIEYKGYFIYVATIEKAYADILYRFGSADVPHTKIHTNKLHSYAKKMGITL